MISPIVTLVFGLFLGFSHAFEADHMLAVATLITEHKSSLRAALIGTFWGIGHTTSLFIIGLVVMLLKITIPERLSLSLELLVAVMLIFLGIRTLLRKERTPHQHKHHHDGSTHAHLHVDHSHHHHHRSFAIGAIHGLAGSGTLMVLVLSTIQSVVGGVVYILLFGIGSIAGMTIMSLVVGVPFLYSLKKFTHTGKVLKTFAGVGSILFGLWMVYEIQFLNNTLAR